MSTTASQSRDLAASLQDTNRAHLFALLRILFGVFWSIDAAFKWVPAFRTQTLQMQFAMHLTKIHTPVIHQWINLWYQVALHFRDPFGYGVAVMETLIAIGLITGCYSRLVFIGGALFSAGIWTAAEGMGLPITAGETDPGTTATEVTG